jgi:hypothetical protein
MIPKKLVILLMAVLFITQIYSWLPQGWKNAKTPYQEYGVYLDEIQEAFARKMFDEFSLIPQGGSGKMHEKVEVIGMGFTARRRATIEEARALILLVMDRFVQEINAHEKIQPFLEIKPITYKRINIQISFEGPNGHYADGSVKRVFNIDGKGGAAENRNRLFYFARDPFRDSNYDLFEESYEEALKHARASPDVNPYAHQTSVLEFNTDQMFSSFVKKMRQKYQLESLSIGGKINPTIEEIGAKFILVKRTTQEEARVFLLAVVDQLIQTINTNDSLRNDLAEYPFPTDRLKIGISFTKKNHYSYRDGSMESVTLENNEVTYYQKPLANASSWPFETPVFAKESYQEALKIVGLGAI